MNDQGMTDISETGTPDWVGWTRRQDKAGNDFFVFKRPGYPPLVRRRLYSPDELRLAYKNDRVVMVKE